ncbi:PAS domain-containing protein [Mucilaginibacter sp. CAU 1740]|uniref:PAS domain-containing protein n=1 Tax=Mucilaginibacter sp. CAU 1740 TaxID=3140365 RepID=UPI00325BC798
MEKTQIAISENTLKRVYGFAISRFSPSFATLNALSVYCGYESWEVFGKTQPKPLFDINVAANLVNEPLVAALLDTPIPTVIFKTNAPDFTIIAYNQAYQEATFTQKRDVKGLTLWEAFNPAKAGGSGPTLLLEAFHEAVYTQQAVQVGPLHYNIPSAIPNISELSWWDIKVVPVIYDGFASYLLVNTHNITDKVLHQDAIEEAIIKELTMTENLAATNVKLSAANKKLADSHSDLLNAKQQLEELNINLENRVFERTKKLFESEAKQRKLIDNAPVAIAVLRGPEHTIETANKKIIDYWGKNNDVLNKPLAVALPELEGQPFIEILSEVRETGVPYINTELRAFLVYNGVFQPRYYDMVYQPVQYQQGVTDSIYIVAVDITEHVIARKKLEESESMLRLAVTAANIGTWSFHPKEKIISYNSIFAEILGWDRDEPLTYETALGQVTDEYRDKIAQYVEAAIADGGEYDFTYTQKRFNDGKLIWLRSTGRITQDGRLDDYVFSGIIREIPDKGIEG